jgi:predicted PurR-regulated permease PerM
MVGGAFTSVFGTIFLVVIVVYRLLDNGATLRQLLRLLPIDVRGRFDRSVQKNVLALQVVITSVTL